MLLCMYTVYNPPAMITYRYPDHEQSVGQIAREMGFNHISLSSLVMPMVRIVPRGFTGTCTGIYIYVIDILEMHVHNNISSVFT